MVIYLERDGGTPGDVSEGHGKEEPNVYLVSETPELSGRFKVNREIRQQREVQWISFNLHVKITTKKDNKASLSRISIYQLQNPLICKLLQHLKKNHNILKNLPEADVDRNGC